MELNSDIFKIKHNGIIPKQGSVLISEPFAPDSIFSRAVILLAEHNKDGTVGFILNKPIDRTLAQITEEFGNNGMKVSIGGPVENGNVYQTPSIHKDVLYSTFRRLHRSSIFLSASVASRNFSTSILASLSARLRRSRPPRVL